MKCLSVKIKNLTAAVFYVDNDFLNYRYCIDRNGPRAAWLPALKLPIIAMIFVSSPMSACISRNEILRLNRTLSLLKIGVTRFDS